MEQTVDKAKQAEYEQIFGKDMGRWCRGDYQRERIVYGLGRVERAIYQAASGKKQPDVPVPEVPVQKVRFDNSTAVRQLREELARHNERRRQAGLEVTEWPTE